MSLWFVSMTITLKILIIVEQSSLKTNFNVVMAFVLFYILLI